MGSGQTPADTLTRQSRLTKTVKTLSGSEAPASVAYYQDIEVTPSMMLDQQKTAQEWLKIRRDIMDRVFGYRECEGKLLRHQAEAIACRRRLELEREKLTDVQTMDIEGRAIEAEARAKYCEQKMEHYHMEILALRAVIEGQDHGIH